MEKANGYPKLFSRITRSKLSLKEQIILLKDLEGRVVGLEVTGGVPQGSILESLLFVIYANYLLE